MSNVRDILNYAWDKDAANLKPALDTAMADKVYAAVSDYTKDYAASLFSATTGQDDASPEDTPEVTQQDSVEVQPDENV
jgi:hypothetical protein